MNCEYVLKCDSECLFVDREESCPLWKHFSTEAKQKDIHTRLNAVGSDKCHANVQELMLKNLVEGIGMAQKAMLKGGSDETNTTNAGILCTC